jgi:radical SAM protein with 4Fe4S-binding SPASM domain
MPEIDKDRRMDDTKLLWHMDRVRDRFDRTERIAPVHIDMGIAKFCNIRCEFCYAIMTQNPSSALIKRDVLLNTMRDAGAIGVRSIGFIGDGEPTCNPALKDALWEGKKAGLDLSVSTSGVLVNNDAIREAMLECCTWMRFCFSAGTREGYKKIHGKDFFDVVVENIKNLVEYKNDSGKNCEIGLQAVFNPATQLDEIFEESKLAVRLGVDYLVIKQCSLPEENSSGNFDLKLYDSDKVIDTLKKCEGLSNSTTQIIPKWNLMQQKGSKPYDYCPSISLISEISGDGSWYPCGYMFGGKKEFNDLKFGNLHEKSLKEIWMSDRYWKIIDYMENWFVKELRCRGCCRQDKCNEFCHNYRGLSNWGKKQISLMTPNYTPRGVNFI